jgi:hypothetical protein
LAEFTPTFSPNLGWAAEATGGSSKSPAMAPTTATVINFFIFHSFRHQFLDFCGQTPRWMVPLSPAPPKTFLPGPSGIPADAG